MPIAFKRQHHWVLWDGDLTGAGIDDATSGRTHPTRLDNAQDGAERVLDKWLTERKEASELASKQRIGEQKGKMQEIFTWHVSQLPVVVVLFHLHVLIFPTAPSPLPPSFDAAAGGTFGACSE